MIDSYIYIYIYIYSRSSSAVRRRLLLRECVCSISENHQNIPRKMHLEQMHRNHGLISRCAFPEPQCELQCCVRSAPPYPYLLSPPLLSSTLSSGAAFCIVSGIAPLMHSLLKKQSFYVSSVLSQASPLWRSVYFYCRLSCSFLYCHGHPSFCRPV